MKVLQLISSIVDLVVQITNELPVFERFLSTSGTALSQLTTCEAIVNDTTAVASALTNLTASPIVNVTKTTFVTLSAVLSGIVNGVDTLNRLRNSSALDQVSTSMVANTSGMLFGIGLAGDVQSLTLLLPLAVESFASFNATQWTAAMTNTSLVVSQLVAAPGTTATLPPWVASAADAVDLSQSKLVELDSIVGVLTSLASQTDGVAFTNKLPAALAQLQALNGTLTSQQPALATLPRVANSVGVVAGAGARLVAVMCNGSNTATVRSVRSLAQRITVSGGPQVAARASLVTLQGDLLRHKAVVSALGGSGVAPLPGIAAFDDALAALRSTNSSDLLSVAALVDAFVVSDVLDVDTKLLSALIATSTYATTFNTSFTEFAST